MDHGTEDPRAPRDGAAPPDAEPDAAPHAAAPGGMALFEDLPPMPPREESHLLAFVAGCLLAVPVVSAAMMVIAGGLLFGSGRLSPGKLAFLVLAAAGCVAGGIGWRRLRGGDTRRAFARGFATGACLVCLVATACGGLVLGS